MGKDNETGDVGTFAGMAPYLHYEDAASFLEWLTSLFGFAEDVRYLNEHGEVAEAEFLVGPTRVMVGGGHAGRSGHGQGQLLVVYVPDVDAHHRRVVAGGLTPDEPQDMPYGACGYEVTDPGGYRWAFWQPQREVDLPEGWKAVRPPEQP